MASLLYAANPLPQGSLTANQNQIAELKTRIEKLKAEGHYDAALWHSYNALVSPAPAHRAGAHLDQGGEDCASATLISSLPYSDTGTTVGFANDYDGGCVGSGAPDVVYAYTPATAQVVNVSLCGSSYDTGLYIFEGSCAGSPIACNDDFCGVQSEVDNVTLTAGTTYYIVVDGFASEAGDYALNIVEVINGRCCYNNNLLCATTTNISCEALSGVFAPGETCDTPCPPPPPQCICGPMDLVFVIDTTGSMTGAINSVVAELPNIITTANYFSCDVRLGLVTFGDQVVVNQQLTTNEAAVQASIAALTAAGGSGIPEASDEALLEVINGTSSCVVNDWTSVFRPTATKIVVLVTDAPPGGCDDAFVPGTDDVHAHAVALAAQAAGIRIAAVYVPTTPPNSPIIVPIMQDYSATTSGSFRQTAYNGDGTGAAIGALVADCGQGILQVVGQPPALTCVNGQITPNPALFTLTVTNSGNLSCSGVTLAIGAGTGTGGTGTITPANVPIGDLAAGASVNIPVSAALSALPAGGAICFHADLTSAACPPAFVDLCFNAPACQVSGCTCHIEDPCEIPPGCYRTETQGGWGHHCHPDGERDGGEHDHHGLCGNPGCILDSNFVAVFPSGLTVGGGFTIHFTSADAVQAYLPAGGSPHVLTSNHVDPTSTEAHVFGGQVVTLAINLAFSNAAVLCFCPGLGDLVVPRGIHSPTGPFAGWTVNDIFTLASQVLGGNIGALPAGISLSDLNGIVDAINNNFDGGNHCEGFLVLPDCDQILPVELSSFTAVGNANCVDVTWVTASERSITGYDLNRQGADGRWTTIARIEGLGDNVAGHTYTHRDADVVTGTLYGYRLFAHEADGSMHPLGWIASATPNTEAATITEYALHQNYPNPFNPTTSIALDLVDNGFVSLKVYNLMGQEVASVINGTLTSGRHVVSFDASHLSSGLYLYRLNVNGFSAEKKMLLMK
jgi:uncharacterized protein YegL